MKNENLEKYIKLKKEADANEQLKAQIVDVKEISNHDFFDSKEYDKKLGLGVYYKIEGSHPEEDALSEWFNIPDTPIGVRTPNSKLNKFYDMYKQIPTVDQAIEVIVNEDGFYRIKM